MKKAVLIAMMSVAMCGCNALGESEHTRTMTDKINKFADSAGSQTLLFNPSRIKAEGTFEDGMVRIQAREAQVLTKAQIDPELRRLSGDAHLAKLNKDDEEVLRLNGIYKEIDRGLWAANDVLIFQVTNKSDTYELPMDKVNYLFVNKVEGNSLNRFVASPQTLDFMNEHMYVVDTESGNKVKYLSRLMEPVAPLDTVYVAVIQTRLRSGQYEAVLSNVPVHFSDSVEDAKRVTFEITKN